MKQREKLRIARRKRGLSQQLIAELLGVTQKTYSQWETGHTEPYAHNIAELCEFFGVDDPTVLDLVEPGMRRPSIPGSVSFDTSDFTLANEEMQEIMEHIRISRRKALITLFGTAGSVLIAPNIEALPRMAEEILPFCAKNIADCWQLSKGNARNMQTARAAITSYIPPLTSLVEQSSKHREQAASLVAQCYRLRSLLSYHLDNLAVASQDVEQAAVYAALTDSIDLRYDILAHAGLVNYYLKRPGEALDKFRQARTYQSNISHAVRCVGLRIQAACEAQVGQESKARKSLAAAYRHHEIHTSTAERSPIHAATENFEMALWEGITKYHLGDDTAIDALESAQPFKANIPERVRTGLINNLVLAELRRPTPGRDLDRLVVRWTEANRRANVLQSKLRQDEVRSAYDSLLVAFPGEQRVRSLLTV